MLKKLSFQDKRILIRVDYNVPIKDGIVTNDYRIRKSMETINYCLNEGASVILISHLGRPNGKVDDNFSLEPIIEVLEKLFNKAVIFSEDCISDASIITSSTMEPSSIHLLENLRFHKGEEDNDAEFASRLSYHADVYINDAFGTAHRKHASNSAITTYFDEKTFGLLIEKEVNYLYEAINTPEKPLVVIMGGAKVKDKISLLENIVNKADLVLIGGALSHPFLKSQGYNISSDFCDSESVKIASNILDLSKENKKPIKLPLDLVMASSIDNVDSIEVTRIEDLKKELNAYDIGPETSLLFSQCLLNAGTILWNGPLGVNENSYFSTGTQHICKIIEELTANGTISIIGGGDTASAVESFSKMTKFTHVSTGGGASLELLSGISLPALEALGYYEK